MENIQPAVMGWNLLEGGLKLYILLLLYMWCDTKHIEGTQYIFTAYRDFPNTVS